MDAWGNQQAFERPAEGRCNVEDGPASIVIHAPRRFHILIAGFLSFWLVGWAVGWVTAVAHIAEMTGPRSGPSGGAGELLFMLAWLGGWTVGGGFAIYGLLYLIGGRETVEFASDGVSVHKSLFGWTRTKRYALRDIKNLRATESTYRDSDGDSRTSRYLSFEHGARTVRVLSGVDPAEIRQLLERVGSRYPGWKEAYKA